MKALVRACGFAARLAVVGGITAASTCASAEATDQETFRCNASHGQFDSRAISTRSDTTIISGRISLHSADTGPEWASLAQVLVHQHGAHYTDGDCGCNGIAAYAFKNPDHIEFRLTANGKDVPIAASPYDAPISFRISISPQGVMTVAVGKINTQIKTTKLLHPEHDTLEMSCSGADVSFLNIAAL